MRLPEKSILAVCVVIYSLLVPAGFAEDGKAVPNEEPPTLAIVGESGAQAYADLLIARLSEAGYFRLVERDRLDAVLAEHKMALDGLTDRDSIRLGRLLGAEGLIWIEEKECEEEEQDGVVVGLTAAGPGVVLWQQHIPGDVWGEGKDSHISYESTGRGARRRRANRAGVV